MRVASGSPSKKPATPLFSNLCSSPSITGALFVALSHRSAEHLVSFQSLPFTLSLEGHSLCVCPGWWLERFSTPHSSTRSPVTPLDATLTDECRVLPCFGRSCPLASPVDATLAGNQPANPFRRNTYENPGRGAPAVLTGTAARSCANGCAGLMGRVKFTRRKETGERMYSGLLRC